MNLSSELDLYMIFQDNPIFETDDYRLEVCLVLRQLERLDKEEFTEDERAEAEEVSKLTIIMSL